MGIHLAVLAEDIEHNRRKYLNRPRINNHSGIIFILVLPTISIENLTNHVSFIYNFFL